MFLKRHLPSPFLFQLGLAGPGQKTLPAAYPDPAFLPVHRLDLVPGRQIGPVYPDKTAAQLGLQLVQASHEIQTTVRRVKKYMMGLGRRLEEQNIRQGNVACLLPRAQGEDLRRIPALV